MTTTLSKSKFKPRALEYLRRVHETHEELVITDRGRPVVRIIPYVEDVDSVLESFRGTVLRYENPTEPVAVEDWEANA